MPEIFLETLVLLVLILNAVTDIRKHEIEPRVVLTAAILTALTLAVTGCRTLNEVLTGAAVGLFIIAVSIVTKGAVGLGDGLLLCVTGCILGFEENFRLLLVGLVLCAAFSTVRLLLKKTDMKGETAFVPYLLLSDIWRVSYMFFKDIKWTRGSFTVEASILVPFLVMIIFAFICLSLYLHDRSVLSACASETAGKGAAQKYETNDHLEAWVLEEAQDLVQGRLLVLQDLEVSAEVTDSLVTVTYTGSSPLLYGISTTEQESATRTNPTENIKATKNLTSLVEKIVETVTDSVLD